MPRQKAADRRERRKDGGGERDAGHPSLAGFVRLLVQMFLNVLGLAVEFFHGGVCNRSEQETAKETPGAAADLKLKSQIEISNLRFQIFLAAIFIPTSRSETIPPSQQPSPVSPAIQRRAAFFPFA